jgi:hypothetical protein
LYRFQTRAPEELADSKFSGLPGLSSQLQSEILSPSGRLHPAGNGWGKS